MDTEIQVDIPIIKKLDIEQCPKGVISRYYFQIVDDGMGVPVFIPIIVARGVEEGITMGIIAAVHGNELNGIPVIQRLFRELDAGELKGTIIGVPVMNVPGYLLMQRKFNDDIDLNRIMPGKPNGNMSEVYAHRFLHKIAFQFDFLIDLHTASFGRINSYYIRANMEEPFIRRLAILQNAQIILNSPAPDQTIRGTLSGRGGKALTLEVGDPNKFQRGHIRSSFSGIFNTLIQLGMLEGEIEEPEDEAIICTHSYWLYTDKGGILQVIPDVTEILKKGDRIAVLKNIFGDVIKEYFAPENGVVIGKSTHPVAQTGSRILHLGIVGTK